MKPIDVVYTWVDGERPDYRQLLQQYSDVPVDLNPERFRDHYQMLRYSMRSLLMFAPWVGNIYLFTTRPHVPEWLDLDHPRIQVFHHDEVYHDKSALPTFNCYSIEGQLHRLPCSDPFVYFNDDYMLGNHCSTEVFVDARGRRRVYGTLFGEYFPWRIREGGISLGFTEHTPLWIEKDLYARCLARFDREYQETLMSRFRKPWNLRMERAYRYYLLAHTRERRAVPFWEVLQHVIFHKITNQVERQRRLLARIERRRPTLLCLNDDQRDNPSSEVTQMVQQFLERYYPQRAPWEASL